MKDKKYNSFSRILNNQKGVSAILVAILLPVLIGFAALAIDVGYMYTTKNELQNIADAAALAGAGELGRIYLNEVDPSNHGTHALTPTQVSQIQTAVQAVAALNKRNDEENFNIILGDNTDNISIGVWNWSLKQLDPPDPGNKKPADAVRVFARRDGAFNGRVTTFFARILSIFGGSFETFESSAVATAALSALSTIEEGLLNTPFAISSEVFISGECPEAITFNSAHDNLVCTAWHNFTDPINPPGNTALDQAEKMLSFINSHEDGDGSSWLQEHFGDYNKIDQVADESAPAASAGDEFEFTWGVQSLIKNESSANTLYFEIPKNDTEFTTYYNAENPVPETSLDDFYSKQGAEPNPMSTAFHYWRFNDGEFEDETDNSVWTAFIPVYDLPCGAPANQSVPIPIVGFAKITIKGVYGPNHPTLKNSVDVEIDCTMTVIEGRGGGGGAGSLMGSIPGLVQ